MLNSLNKTTGEAIAKPIIIFILASVGWVERSETHQKHDVAM